jgi:hypothetical protein
MPARRNRFPPRGCVSRSTASAVMDGLVPDEGIEPPTFGLQNRCSTAELIRPGRRTGGNRRPYTRTVNLLLPLQVPCRPRFSSPRRP